METVIIDFSQYVEESNFRFENSTPEGKRVMIVEDVIKRLDAEQLIARSGAFFNDLRKEHTLSASLKDFVNSGNQCTVCAKGALFCSLVGRINKATLREADQATLGMGDSAHTKLAQYFTPEQLDLIEIAFEGQSFMRIVIPQGNVRPDNYKEDAANAVKFFRDHFTDYMDDPDTRLRAICNNIIENNGTFIP